MEEIPFQFDDTFEQRLLAFLVRDIKFFLRNANLMREMYFMNQIRRDIFHFSSRYMEKYGESPSLDISKNEVYRLFEEKKKKDVAIDLYLELLEDLYQTDLSGGSSYAEDVLVSFAQSREMEKVLMDGAKLVRAKHDLSPILTGVTKVLGLGNKLELGYDYWDEVISRTSRGYDMPEQVVTTGFKRLNKFLGGGLAGGELGVIVAPPNRGKTAAMVNIAHGALVNRKNVIFIGLEGKEDDVAIRFDMRFSRIRKDLLLKESDKVRDILLYQHKLLKSKLILKMFPAETVTVSDIDQYITREEIVQGFKADLIIIDYLNLCKRSNPREDTWLGTNYREGKSMAHRRNRPIWTGVQGKEGSLRENVVSPKHIAESTIRIWADSDVVIGLCQSEEEEKKEPMELRWFLGKNRNRERGKTIPMIFDNFVMMMEEVPLK